MEQAEASADEESDDEAEDAERPILVMQRVIQRRMVRLIFSLNACFLALINGLLAKFFHVLIILLGNCM